MGKNPVSNVVYKQAYFLYCIYCAYCVVAREFWQVFSTWRTPVDIRVLASNIGDRCRAFCVCAFRISRSRLCYVELVHWVTLDSCAVTVGQPVCCKFLQGHPVAVLAQRNGGAILPNYFVTRQTGGTKPKYGVQLHPLLLPRTTTGDITCLKHVGGTGHWKWSLICRRNENRGHCLTEVFLVERVW